VLGCVRSSTRLTRQVSSPSRTRITPVASGMRALLHQRGEAWIHSDATNKLLWRPWQRSWPRPSTSRLDGSTNARSGNVVRGRGKPQISPLRSFGAPVEMTKGRGAVGRSSRSGNEHAGSRETKDRSLIGLSPGRFRPTHPEFPVQVSGVEQLYAALFERKPHAWSWQVLRSRKSGRRWCEHGAPVRSCGTR
jgi:hypothetical protein